jgi:hypothetical protein
MQRTNTASPCVDLCQANRIALDNVGEAYMDGPRYLQGAFEIGVNLGKFNGLSLVKLGWSRGSKDKKRKNENHGGFHYGDDLKCVLIRSED